MVQRFFVLIDTRKSLAVPTSAVCSLILMLGLSTPVRADKITSMLTARDLEHPIILTASGQVVSSPDQNQGAAAATTTPVYVAYALSGGEHLPSGLTTITDPTASGATSTGPFPFSPTFESSLGSALATSGSALVQTGNQEYLVAYLPRYDGTSSSSSSTSTTSGLLKQIGTLLSTPSNDLTSLTTTAETNLEKWLQLNNAHRSTTKPSLNLSLNLESQPSSSSTSTSSSSPASVQEAQVLEVPAPEPAAWLIFGVLLGGAVARERAQRRKRAVYPA